MAEGSVGSVWHKSLANLPSITVYGRSTLFFIFPPHETDKNAVLCLFFLHIHPYIAHHLCKAPHSSAPCMFARNDSYLPCCMQCRCGLAKRILSVHPSVCQTRDLWQNGRMIHTDFYTICKIFSLVSWEEEWLVGGDSFYVKFFVSQPPLERNWRFQLIFACSSSAITPIKKSSINTNWKSLCAFQWA